MNLLPLIRRLKIIPKDQGVVSLVPNSSQQKIIDEVERQHQEKRPIRIAILKARQVGTSTIVQAIKFCFAFLYKPSHGLTLAHDSEVARHLHEITKLYWETFPFRSAYKARYETKYELVWDFGSSLRIGSAKVIAIPRGRTIHSFHGSEVAFWQNPSELMGALAPSIPNAPGTLSILESTANGIGDYWYNLVAEAQQGNSDYKLIFIPWFEHTEYFLRNFPVLGRLDDEEKLLRKGFKLSDAQLAWRRWAIQNNCEGLLDKFHQEYPSTVEEAFVSSGNNLFHVRDLQAVYHSTCPGRSCIPARGYLMRDPNGSIRFQSDPDGPLKIYKAPSRKFEVPYMISGDPTFTTQGDPAVVQAINRRSYEQVATWEGHIDPISFAEELAKIGTFYNNALVTTETEGPGYGCASPDTEVLTRNGWKLMQDILPDDYVATRSLATQTFEWQKPTAVVSYPFDGEMVRVYSPSLDLMLTPNHRMLLNKLPRKLGGHSEKKKPGDAVVTCEELEPVHLERSHGIPTWSHWNAPDLERMEFKGAADARGKTKDITMTGDQFAAFMGMYLSEGYLATENGKPHTGIRICQEPKGKGYAQFRQLLTEILGRAPTQVQGRQWTLHSLVLGGWLVRCGVGAANKRIPREILDMSRRQLRIFWDYYFLGDGNYEKRGHPTKEQQVITTASEVMAGQLQEVAQKIGFSATIQIREGRQSLRRDGKIIHGGRQYVVRLLKARNRYFKMQRVPYVGDVWCLSVPNSIMYVRRNGKPAWTGNTIGRLAEIYPRIWGHQRADYYPGFRRGNALGWSSSYKRKEWAIGWLRKLIRDTSIAIHDPRTYEQLRGYGMTAKGLGNLDPKGNDDHVMALAIAVICSVTEGPVMTQDVSPLELARQAVEELDL